MTTYTPEEHQFINFWIPRIRYHMEETGILPLELLANLTAYPDEVRFLERHLKLKESGNVNQFIENYREKYYTKQCLAYQTPDECLTKAASSGQREIVEMLLAHADNFSINMALIEASKEGHREIVEMLVPLATDGFNRAMIEAAKGGYREIIELLLLGGLVDDFAIYEAMKWGAWRGHREIVKMLLPFVNVQGIGAAMKWAAKEGHRYIVDLLLPLANVRGIDVAMTYAAKEGHREIVELLLHRATVRGINMAMIEASKGGNREIVDMLLPRATDRGISVASEKGH